MQVVNELDEGPSIASRYNQKANSRRKDKK